MTRRAEVVTIGEAMVSFRSSGPLAAGGPLTPGLAGAESNVAIGLARLGHDAEWIGRVGPDAFGELVLRDLRAEAVRIDRVVVDTRAPTGLMFLEQRTADISRVDYRRTGSAGSRLGPDDVADVISGRPRALHVSGVTPALSPTAREAFVHAVESASAASIFVSLDVNYRSRLWAPQEARQTLRPVALRADVVIASEDELALVAPGAESAAVTSLLESGVAMVAVKRGAVGASLWTPYGRIDQGPFPVTSVDTVGAGDAFCAGLLSGWLDGLEPAGCLERASLLGAWAVSTVGDWHGLPRRGELDALRGLRPGETLR
jgi:2-dehydro-3-deoxygluconokinase